MALRQVSIRDKQRIKKHREKLQEKRWTKRSRVIEDSLLAQVYAILYNN
jgi:hypothetical protein